MPAQGTTIEITLWRGLAEKFYDHLEEGRVYIFRRGQVKLANKNYKTVRNDYTIHMDSGCASAGPAVKILRGVTEPGLFKCQLVACMFVRQQ